MTDKKTFGSFIKQKRIEKNYSQKELAELLFVTESAVSKWERGITYPDISLVSDICRVLEITEHELIESSTDTEYRMIQNEAKKFKNIKKGLFWTLNICYLTAILVCFIVNLAVNHTLSWFFIVLSSIVCAYTFVPTITSFFTKCKKLIFVGSTFLSLFLLFFTCSIYTNDYWFMVATCGVLIGYFVIFYPILFTIQKKYLSNEKYDKLSKNFLLTYFSGILFLICVLLIFINIYTTIDLGKGLLITICLFIIPLIMGLLKSLNVPNNIFKLIGFSFGLLLIVLCLISLLITSLTNYEEDYYNIESSYSMIEIDVDVYDVNIYAADFNKIEYIKTNKITLRNSVCDGKLLIEEKDSRPIFAKLFSFGVDFKVNIYLTQTEIEKLIINCETGDISINEGFTFGESIINCETGDINICSDFVDDLFIENSTGSVSIINSNIPSSISCAGRVRIETKTGTVKLTNVNCGELVVRLSTGDIKLINVLVSGDAELYCKTGDIIFDKVDALNYYVETRTGNIKGTVLSKKYFIAQSETGKVDVPAPYIGGVCELKTSTGNIKIEVVGD